MEAYFSKYLTHSTAGLYCLNLFHQQLQETVLKPHNRSWILGKLNLPLIKIRVLKKQRATSIQLQLQEKTTIT